jgi:hypothetical protein
LRRRSNADEIIPWIEFEDDRLTELQKEALRLIAMGLS